MNPSKKHHYLPRHYLKGFTHDDDGFFVFDKFKGKIFSSNPDAFFLENELNTVVLPRGNSSTFIEDQYTELENQCWPSLDRIRESDSKTVISYQDKEFMVLFLSSLYWRLPSNIDITEKWSESAFTNTSPVDYFALKNKKGETIPKFVVDSIRGSAAFKKSFKIILSMAPFLKDKNWGSKLHNWRFLYTQNQKRFYIIGDNPILTRRESHEDPVTLLDEFVFPISGNILLINSNAPLKTGLPGEFTIQHNVAMIERAKRFVICQDLDFLTALVEHHKFYVSHNKTNTILDTMFDMLR